MYEYECIGKRIKECRKRRNFTQERLAELAGVTSQHISHIERGITKISVVTLINVANTLDVSMDELLCDSVMRSSYVYSDKLEEIVKKCRSHELNALLEIITQMSSILHKYEESCCRNCDKNKY